MLFTLQDLNLIGDDKLQQDENYKFGSISPPVERLDGKVDKWAPKYLAVPQPLATNTRCCSFFIFEPTNKTNYTPWP